MFPMNDLAIAKIQNTYNEITNQISKGFIDPANARTLMQRAANQLNQLITHISYIESKLESTLESNKIINDLLLKYIDQFGDQFVD